MLKVLVVDDERIMRLALKTIIKWEDNGFRLIGEAKDGSEALDMIRTQIPDIVITDLIMPNVGGLELIETLMRQDYRGKIIVLSNYSDFESVRIAMRSGAMDYILKVTMKADDLLTVLRRAEEKLTEENMISEQHNRAESELRKSQLLLRNQLLKEIFLDGSIHIDEDNKERFEIEKTLDRCNSILYITFAQTDKFEVHEKVADEKLMTLSVVNIIKDILKESSEAEVVDIDRISYAAVFNVSSDHPELILRKYAKELSDYLRMYLNMFPVIVAGDGFSGIREMRCAYSDCLQAVKNRFYSGKKTIIICSEEVRGNAVDLPGLSAFTSDILRFIDNANFEGMTGFINESIDFSAENRISPEHLKEYFTSAFDVICSVCASRGMDCYEEMDELKNNAKNSDTVTDFKNNINDIAGSIYKKMHTNKTDSYRKEILQSIEYIKDNLGNKITLEMIAKTVSLNESYLCRIFKSETGKSLISFINEMKMEKAKELLKSPDTTVKDAAEAVGIDNQFYFCKLFKKHTGICPSEFNSRTIRNH